MKKMFFVIISMLVNLIISTNVSAQIKPDYELAQTIKLESLIAPMPYLPVFKGQRPETRWEKKNWTISALKTTFIITELDSLGILHGRKYFVFMYYDNTINKIIQFEVSTKINGVNTDISFSNFPEGGKTLSIVESSFTQKEGFTEYALRDFMCEFGFCWDNSPPTIFANQPEFIPETIWKDLATIGESRWSDNQVVVLSK